MFVEGGATKVWLVGGAQELTELPSKEAGQLYDSECYLVQYTYSTPGEPAAPAASDSCTRQQLARGAALPAQHHSGDAALPATPQRCFHARGGAWLRAACRVCQC
jgi:hypothetical protein